MAIDEFYRHGPDLLVVLGKNIGVGATPEEIRRKPHHLSPESRMNVLAAGALWSPEVDVLFSTGQTAGSDTPSEASAMKRYFMHRYPHIPESRLLTEEQSIDTAGNAEEVARMLVERGQPYKRIGLVTVGYHLDNAVKLFANYGVPVADKYAAEVEVRRIHPVLGRYVRLWSESERVISEYRRERVRSLLLPIDRKGKLLRQVTARTRQ